MYRRLPQSCAILAFVALFQANVADAEEFFDQVEKDFSLRSIGQLNITNLRGPVTVQGWAMDKIRVRAKRRVTAETPEEARRLFSAMDFRYRSVEQDVELSADYGKGLEIQDRLKERAKPQASMEMLVLAPANLMLRVWAVDGEAVIRSWKSSKLEVRSTSGTIRLEHIDSDQVSVTCPSCAIQLKDVKGSLRCVGGTHAVTASDVQGTDIYVETSSGDQELTRVSGNQLMTSRSGNIQGQELRGRIEFQTQDGRVELLNGSGFVSGRSNSGHVNVRMRDWKFEERALIESRRGDVTLSVPSWFAGEIDLWSIFGKTVVEFPVQKSVDPRAYGPEPPGHFLGKIGSRTGPGPSNDHLLRIRSESGNVRLLRNI